MKFYRKITNKFMATFFMIEIWKFGKIGKFIIACLARNGSIVVTRSIQDITQIFLKNSNKLYINNYIIKTKNIFN